LLDGVATNSADKPAVCFGSGTITYFDLIATVNRLAAFLRHQGIRPGDKIALVTRRSPEMLISILAILRAGACYIPIDPDYPRLRVEFMLGDSGANLLLHSAEFEGQFHTMTPGIVLEKAWEELSPFTTEPPQEGPRGDSLAYILYTSGSTGNPKGVQIEHHSLLNLLLSMQQLLMVTPQDRLLAITTISFDIAGLELFLPLLCGAELILADSITSKDARLLLDMLRKKDITIMQATPSAWKMLVEVGWDKPLPLKILCGGEALREDLASRLLSLGKEAWNLYGPTETTIWSTAKKLHEGAQIVSIGLPISNTHVYILDEHLNPVPAGATGEIFIAGDGVARGYLNRPELTAARFLSDPFAVTPGEKMYRTGDLGRILDDGDIQCLGRIDHQIKIHGHRVEPAEIEKALLSQEGIREALVISDGDQLLAYIILAPGTQSPYPQHPSPGFRDPAQSSKLEARSSSISIWRQNLRNILPEFMIPHHFVILESLPLTPNGKIDRQALPLPEKAAGPSGANAAARVEHATPTERLVAQIWAECLGGGAPGRQDDFFEYGGNSINALRIMNRIEKETGRRLPLASLFQAPTIEKLSLLLDAADPAISWDPLVSVKPGNDRKPLYIVQGHGMNVITFNNIARHMHPAQPIYGFQARGLNGIDKPLATIEEMAADYISSMLKVDRGDSFCLAGYSYGGIVAFEMARQLAAMGKTIQMLAIIDTYADWTRDKDSTSEKLFIKIRRQWPKFLYVAKSIRKYPRQALAYQWQFFLRKVSEVGAWFGERRAPDDYTLEDAIDETYEHACQTYRMTAFEGKVDLFRVNTRLYFLDDLEYMGWRSYARRGVTIHEIQGDHKTFMLPPNDRIFAETLQKVLDESALSGAGENRRE
jgi:amino acid adenylation domain-containing protein